MTGAMRPKRVLVAEDDPEMRDLIVISLVDAEAEVACVANGAEALARLQSADFDAVVLDLVMPGMGGAAVMTEIRRSGLDVPVIVVSGYVGMLDEKRLAELGAARVLKKPFKAEELRQAVLSAAGAEAAPALDGPGTKGSDGDDGAIGSRRRSSGVASEEIPN